LLLLGLSFVVMEDKLSAKALTTSLYPLALPVVNADH